MDLSNSERESVIESAIDTISAIGRCAISRNSLWLQKKSEAFEVGEAIRGIPQMNRNDVVHHEVAEDSRNLHSDASSIYPDNKFGSIQSTQDSDYRLHTHEMKGILQRQGTFENTSRLDNSDEVLGMTTSKQDKTASNDTNKRNPETRMKATSSNTAGLSQESIPYSNMEQNSKGTLHGHEVGICAHFDNATFMYLTSFIESSA